MGEGRRTGPESSPQFLSDRVKADDQKRGLGTLTSQGDTSKANITAASEKLAVVAKDLAKQVAHFQV